MSNHPAVHQQLAKDVLTFVIALRFLNALCVATFFQPDEYFQALEPAWQIAFGHESGAWITWVRIFLHFLGKPNTKTQPGMAVPATVIAASCFVCLILLCR